MTTCSATLMLLQYVTSATVTPPSIAACRSTWSEPMPAVIASFRLGAFAKRSAVRYAGQNGCEMTTSASGSRRSNSESGPSLSAVTISVWPPPSRNGRSPSSPRHAAEQLTGREVDRLRRRRGLPVEVVRDLGDAVARVRRRVPVDRVVVEHAEDGRHESLPGREGTRIPYRPATRPEDAT